MIAEPLPNYFLQMQAELKELRVGLEQSKKITERISEDNQIPLDAQFQKFYGQLFELHKQLALNTDRLADAVRRANSEAGGASIEIGEAEHVVRASGYLKSDDDFRAIPLKLAEGGVPVTLGDVAWMESGPQMRRGIAELNGQGEVAGGVVIARVGANARDVIAAVKRVSGCDFEVAVAGRRPGDPATIVADAGRMRNDLGWAPRFDDLDTIVGHALAWEQRLAAIRSEKLAVDRRA